MSGKLFKSAPELPEKFLVSDFKKEWKTINGIREHLKLGYGKTDPWLENQFHDVGFELRSGKIFPKNLPNYRIHLNKAWRIVKELEIDTCWKFPLYRRP